MFLLLAAQYESVLLPLAVILIVPMCLLAAISGVLLRGMDNNILTQIGFVVLIGLAAKNAILIVEFARQAEEQGADRREAAVQAARTRLRPILMTSLRLHPGRGAAGAGDRRRRRDAAGARHRGVLRHARRDVVRADVHAGVLRAGALDREPRPRLTREADPRAEPRRGKTMPRPTHLLLALACLLAALNTAACAEDFYKGKTITLLVGSAEGGGYDQYARLLARHMGKYIAGEPAIVVKNQPAAGGMAMANAMYATVPRDGLTFGMMARDNPLEPLLGNTAAKFKPENFTWLGTSSRYEDDAFCLVIRADTGITDIADLQKPGRPAIFGGQAAGGSETDIVLIARDVFRLNIQYIRGYRSSTDTLLALRRGEIEGRAITTSTLQKSMADWLERGMLRYLMQFGHETRWKGLPDVPTARELARTPEDKARARARRDPVPDVAPVHGAARDSARAGVHSQAGLHAGAPGPGLPGGGQGDAARRQPGGGRRDAEAHGPHRPDPARRRRALQGGGECELIAAAGILALCHRWKKYFAK